MAFQLPSCRITNFRRPIVSTGRTEMAGIRDFPQFMPETIPAWPSTLALPSAMLNDGFSSSGEKKSCSRWP